jgi:signal transduction histidine kinase
MRNLNLVLQRLFSDSGRLLGLMLLCLHGYLLTKDASAIHSALLITHVGFFLMWQPLSRQSKQLSLFATLAILISASIVIIYINWWMMAFWVAALFALIAGRVFSTNSAFARLPYILAASYLSAILLLWIVPSLLNASNDLAAADFLLTYFLPILPLLILYLSINKVKEVLHENETANIDFFYTLLIFLTTLIVILGSFVIGIVWQAHYLELLTLVVMALALTMVALSWLWNPSATFSGIELLMSRYLLSLGLPFEQWIRKIAQYAQSETTASLFLNASMQELAALNWVSGIDWNTHHIKDRLGEHTSYISTFSYSQLKITLYSKWQFTPAMYLHVQLLTQILGEFYDAKLREDLISQNAFTQALYETGSRLTHDIKNILQSLGALCAAAEHHIFEDDNPRFIALMQKQLPLLNQRLGNTLSKLTAPQTDITSNNKSHLIELPIWWAQFKQLNAYLTGPPYFVTFDAPKKIPQYLVKAEVLESVIDNLLQNAINKAKLDPEIQIKVAILPKATCCIEVSDTGEIIPNHILDKLLTKPVSSSHGLGVGLYHAAQQAEQEGYRLSVRQNGLSETGEHAVIFRLEQII